MAAIDARWSCLADQLPVPKEASWERLAEIAEFFADAEDDKYCASEIEEAIYGETDQAKSRSHAKSIGHLLAKLPGASRPKPTVKTKNGDRRKGRFHKTNALQQRLHSYGVLERQDDGEMCVNPLITGNFSIDVNQRSLSTNRTLIPLSFYPCSFIPPYTEADLEVLEERWHAIHGFSFSFMTALTVSKQVLNDSIFDDDFSYDRFPCLRFKLGRNDARYGYAVITQQYLDAALPNQGFRTQDLPTITAHRLINMIVQPDELKRWDHGGRTKHLHHCCRSVDCIMPSHHVIILDKLHQQIHKSAGHFDHGSIVGDDEF